ncbi:MAG: class I SAM-dependent methyltransferase [Dehalococcoidales bacterium]|nr:class I SAM-dependent methyltransferase [Dehalococcoidales bacterium]
MTAENQVLKESFESYIKQAEEAAFSGWDFSFVMRTGRMVEAPLKWNYYNFVLPHLDKAEKMLDMGTGGGEVLSQFAPLPLTTYATEQYHPNVAVARKRLEPLGVKVFELEEEKSPPYSAHLPFKDAFFDLILNRHEAYYPPELMRILKTGGVFITQQVGSLNNATLVQFFLGKTIPISNWNLKSAVDELKAAGFKIFKQQEDIQFFRFYDIGAIVYFLKAVPWTIKNFSVATYRDKLWELHIKISEDGFYDTPKHRFIVLAEK